MKTTIKHCQYCHIEFAAIRSDAKFCSGACKQNAYNERIKLQIEQIATDELRKQSELSAQLDEVKKELEEVKKAKEAEQKLANETSYKLLNETFKKYECAAIKEKIDTANKTLKGWLMQLLEIDEQDETSVFKIKSLFEEIIRSESFAFYNLPNDYKYLSFIKYRLIPKVKNWHNTVKYSRERYIDLCLPKEEKKIFTDILYEIE